MNKMFFLPSLVILFSCSPGGVSKDRTGSTPADSSVQRGDSISAIRQINLPQADSLGEYTSYTIFFSVETIRHTLYGYTNIPTNILNRDSLQSFSHLKRALVFPQEKPDSLNYWKECFALDLAFCDSNKVLNEHKSRIYYHAGKASLPMAQIREIKIRSIFVDHSIGGIANSLTKEDTAWINTTTPIRCVNLGGYLCAYTVLIYKQSKEVDLILREIRSALSAYKEINPENGDEVDHLLHKEIQKLEAEKGIVIVGGCTC